MTSNKTDYAACIAAPEYENIRSILRAETIQTRPLQLIVSHMARIQQQLAARADKDLWLGDSQMPVEGALFTGSSGCGKSIAMRYAVQTMPAIKLHDGGSMASNPVYIDTPADGTMGALAKEIIRVVDDQDMSEPKDKHAPGKAKAAFDRHDLTIVAIDEITRIINPQRHSGQALRSQSHLLWTMVVQLLDSASPIPIAMCGLPHLLDSFLIKDKKEENAKHRREAHRRMKVVVLPELDIDLDGAMLEGSISAYCARAGVGSKIKDDDHIVPRLVHAAAGQAGSALVWIQKAVALAKVRPRGKLDRDDFAYVYGDMTSAARGANPFLATGWDRINVGKVAPKSFADAAFKEVAR